MALKTNAVDINRGTTGLTLTPDQANEVITKTLNESAVLRLARRIDLPGRGLNIPVVTGDPVADFVAESAEKPVSNSTFNTKTMTPYKIAVIELFSNEFRRDFGMVYDELVRRLPYALGRKLDATVFNGTAPGTGFDVISDSETQDIETSPYAGLVAAYGKIAEAEYVPTAFAMAPAGEVLLYGATGTDGHPIFLPSVADGSIGAVLGTPVIKAASVYDADSKTLGVLGDWNQMLVGIASNVDLAITEEATINTGTEQVNLWQRNMFGVRAEFEVGVVAEKDAFVRLTGAASSKSND